MLTGWALIHQGEKCPRQKALCQKEPSLGGRATSPEHKRHHSAPPIMTAMQVMGRPTLGPLQLAVQVPLHDRFAGLEVLRIHSQNRIVGATASDGETGSAGSHPVLLEAMAKVEIRRRRDLQTAEAPSPSLKQTDECLDCLQHGCLTRFFQ